MFCLLEIFSFLKQSLPAKQTLGPNIRTIYILTIRYSYIIYVSLALMHVDHEPSIDWEVR